MRLRPRVRNNTALRQWIRGGKAMQEFDLKACVPTYPGFPKEGVNFYDITG